MPKIVKSESEIEKLARKIVEDHLRIKLVFADLNGQVDYLTCAEEDLEIAVEVTSFTNQDKWQLSKMDHQDRYLVENQYLRRNWLINVRGVPNFSKINRDLLPRLVDLELHHLFEVHVSSQCWWLETVPTLEKFVREIKSNNVEYLTSRVGTFKDQQETDPRLVAITHSENWTFGGVNSSLTLIENFLLADENNKRKLLNTNFENRHLFLWVDEFSAMELREIFEREMIELPSRPVDLPSEINHIWIADSKTRVAMYFDSSKKWELIYF